LNLIDEPLKWHYYDLFKDRVQEGGAGPKYCSNPIHDHIKPSILGKKVTQELRRKAH